MAHEHIFAALDTIVFRKLEHMQVSQKVRGNTACQMLLVKGLDLQ